MLLTNILIVFAAHFVVQVQHLVRWGYIDDNFWSTQAAMALCTMSAWFWYTVFLYHSSSAVTTPSYPHSWLPSRNPLTLHWRSYTFFHPLCRFPFPASHPPLPLALTSTPPSFSSSSFPSFLEDFDNGTFLDCSHEYRGLRSDIAYSLSDIFCDALPPHSAVNWSECDSPTLVWSEAWILLCLLNNAGYVV